MTSPDPIRATTVRKNRLALPRHQRRLLSAASTPTTPAWNSTWDAATESLAGGIDLSGFTPLAIPHMEAFPPYGASVLDACIAEATATPDGDTGADLQVTFTVAALDDRPFVTYVGVDPPVRQPTWEAALDTGGEEVSDLDEVLFLTGFGWEPDPDDDGQWYRSWPADTPSIRIASEVGLLMLRVLNPNLSWDWEIGVTVFREDPVEGRIPIGDATDAVLSRVNP